MEDLNELLLEELKDLYSAEKQIVKALPKIVRSADSEELKEAIAEHLEITKSQVARLEEAFAELGQKPTAKHCKGMEGLLAEGDEIVSEQDKGVLRDLQLIGAAQRVEHYEVAAYGTARAVAEHLGKETVMTLLETTLAEEEEADSRLTEVAQSLYGEVEMSDEEDDEEMATNSSTARATATRGPAVKKSSKGK